MKSGVQIENIEGMRRREGIEDVELREEIRRLEVGDCVMLTLLSGTESFAGETVEVRITSINGYALRGKLVTKPVSLGLAELHAGSTVGFTTAHIHSLPRKLPTQGKRLDKR
jgi:hypothetical protein